MRYVKAKWQQSQQDLAYRIYITDSLYALERNQILEKRFIDFIYPPEVDDRDGNEIATDVIQRLGLKVEK